MNPRKTGIREMTITPSSGKDVRDTMQLDGIVTGKDLHGKNVVTEHKSGKPVMGHGALGGSSYSKK